MTKPKHPPKPVAKLKAEVVERRYCIELSVEQFDKIIDRDADAARGGKKTLYDYMSDAGGIQIEYEAHFGSYVWFNLEADDPPEKLDQLVHIVELFVSGKKIPKDMPAPTLPLPRPCQSWCSLDRSQNKCANCGGTAEEHGYTGKRKKLLLCAGFCNMDRDKPRFCSNCGEDHDDPTVRMDSIHDQVPRRHE